MSTRPPLEALRSEAVGLMRAGSKSGVRVIELNEAILAIDPTDNDARTRLGFAYRVCGEFGKAEAAYREIVALAPDSELARIAERALAMIGEERRGAAAISVDDQLASVVDPADAGRRSAALRDGGRLDAALRWATRAVELAAETGDASNRLRALAVRSSVHRKRGDSAAALSDARASRSLRPDFRTNPSSYILETACLLDCGEVWEALVIAANHLETDTGSRHAQNTAGRALFLGFRETGDPALLDRSTSCFGRAVTLGGDRTALEQLSRNADALDEVGSPQRAAEVRALIASLRGGDA